MVDDLDNAIVGLADLIEHSEYGHGDKGEYLRTLKKLSVRSSSRHVAEVDAEIWCKCRTFHGQQ